MINLLCQPTSHNQYYSILFIKYIEYYSLLFFNPTFGIPISPTFPSTPSIPIHMSGKQPGINIDGVAATKALEALRKHADLPRKGKTEIEKSEGDLLRLIIGLKDKEEYKKEKEVLINLRCSIDSKDENYEIVFITKGDSSKMRGKLDSIPHLTTVYISF